MGTLTSISQFLGGGESSKSGNKNNSYLMGALSPDVSTGSSAMGQMAALLGLGGDSAAAQQGLNNYANSAGYNFQLHQGMDAVNNNMYSRGLGESGADMKGLAQFQSGLNQQYLQNYLGNLGNMSKLGLGAAGTIADAGKYQNDQSQKGMGGILGGILGAISDRRLKRDIERVGTYPNGLGKYEWHYAFDPTKKRYRGVMADEVKLLRPDAHIPNFRGEYAGVNYALLGLQMEAA